MELKKEMKIMDKREVFNSINGEKPVEESGLKDNVMFPLKMDEYTTFLEYGLCIASEKKKPSKKDIDELFANYFLSRIDSYKGLDSFSIKNKRYPIFSESIFIDIPLALKYGEIRDKEAEENGGAPIGNGDAEDFFVSNEIIAYKDDIWKVFTDPTIYTSLRGSAFPYYKKTIKQSKNHFNDKINYLNKWYEDIQKKQNGLMEKSSHILNLITDEIKNHLSKFGNKAYTVGAIPLNDKHKIILMLYFLKELGFDKITPTDFNSFMESVFGKGMSNCRKLVTTIRDIPYLGYKNAETCGDAKEAILLALNSISNQSYNKKIIKEIKNDLIYKEQELIAIISKRE
jgi:predicted lactoylglutathione lyase